MRSWPDVRVPAAHGPSVALRLFDTSDATVRPVSPGETATMYVCGITPYDATHLGHAATYLAFDLIGRVLRANGHRVRYVQNVTDVDDPLFERADRDGIDWRDLGAREIELFRKDMQALRVLPPAEYIGAVESVDEAIAMTEKLLSAGAAYVVDDAEYPDVYYRADATLNFGYESGYDRAAMETFFAERGGDPDRPGKRDRIDPILWRMRRPGEPSWPSPWGDGRPGWHIECAAIAFNRLGDGFDIQGGGSDLIFPHHEYSAAHVEAATGSRRFARHYVHAAMIGLDGEKMSKSRGNLVFVSALRRSGVDPAAIRLGLFEGHYRTDRPWSEAVLRRAQDRLALWRAAFAAPSAPEPGTVLDSVRTHLANDLDTPRALAALDAWATDAVQGRGHDTGAPALVADTVDALLGVV